MNTTQNSFIIETDLLRNVGDVGNLVDKQIMSQDENRYLLLGFFEFAILATLMTVFFPWSLLFCLFVFGMQETKLIIVALLHDFIKTLLAVAAVVVVIAISVVVLIALLAK